VVFFFTGCDTEPAGGRARVIPVTPEWLDAWRDKIEVMVTEMRQEKSPEQMQSKPGLCDTCELARLCKPMGAPAALLEERQHAA
jgi:hypothetical protein